MRTLEPTLQPDGFYHVYVDGSYKDKKITAGVVMLTDDPKNPIRLLFDQGDDYISQYQDEAFMLQVALAEDNNYSEYIALAIGIRETRNNAPLKIFSDSKNAVNFTQDMMAATSKQNPTRIAQEVLIREAKRFERGGHKITYIWASAKTDINPDTTTRWYMKLAHSCAQNAHEPQRLTSSDKGVGALQHD